VNYCYLLYLFTRFADFEDLKTLTAAAETVSGRIAFG